jgi:hypothetical protein
MTKHCKKQSLHYTRPIALSSPRAELGPAGERCGRWWCVDPASGRCERSGCGKHPAMSGPPTAAKMTNMSSRAGRPPTRSGLCCRVCVRRTVLTKPPPARPRANSSARRGRLAFWAMLAAIIVGGTPVVTVFAVIRAPSGPQPARPTGIPASVSDAQINLMGLSPSPHASRPGSRSSTRTGAPCPFHRGSITVSARNEPACGRPSGAARRPRLACSTSSADRPVPAR